MTSSSGSIIADTELAADRCRALALTPVSRETLLRLDRYVAHVLTRQRSVNLVASSTLPHIWTRHVADSLQLIALAPEARIWIDVGSGAGFPGLAIACALAEKPNSVVHLIESNAKKAGFLQEAAMVTGAPAVVHRERIEMFAARFREPADIVCARAVSPLKLLLKLCFPLLQKNGVTALFPKGQNAQRELDDARKSWTMHATLVPSRTDPNGRIVVIRDLERTSARHKFPDDL
jgi:16S rRNA (guanine527-N7)-methyltransferase